MNKQLQITFIDNGILIATAGEQPSELRPQGTPPSVMYATDYVDFCNKVKKHFPVEVK